MINRKAFFDKIRHQPFSGTISQSQVEGIEVILDEWEKRKLTDLRWLAYMLATTYHETAHTMRPIHEIGGRSYFDKYETGTSIGATLGNTVEGDGYRYRGRGFVQVTGRANYSRMKDITGYNLVGDPELALRPNVAAAIMFEGMIRGTFTTKKLSNYFDSTTTDWTNARRIINGLDRAELIAGYARQFHGALGAAGTVTGTPKPATPVKKPPSGVGGAVGTIVVAGGAAVAANQSGVSVGTTILLMVLSAGAVIAIMLLYKKFKQQSSPV